jgi:hypothetical protein
MTAALGLNFGEGLATSSRDESMQLASGNSFTLQKSNNDLRPK